MQQRSLDGSGGLQGGAGASGGGNAVGTSSGPSEVQVTIDGSVPTDPPLCQPSSRGVKDEQSQHHDLLRQQEDGALVPHEEQKPVVLYDTSESRLSAGIGGLRRGGGGRGTILERTSPRKEGGRLLLRGSSVGGDELVRVGERGRKAGGIGARLRKLLLGSGASDLTRGRGLRGNGSSSALSKCCCCCCSAFSRTGWWRVAVLLSASALLLLLLLREMGQVGRGALGI